MKTLSKSVLSGFLLTSVLGLTACQNMPMSQHQANMPQEQIQAEKLTEGQILQVLSIANKGEIAQAQAALPRLETAEVRSFAQNMIAKHTENENKGMALANMLGLSPQYSNTSNMVQRASNDVVTKLNGMQANADKTYIMNQVEVHKKVLMTIDNSLIPQAQTPELRQFLAQTRSAVAMHLQAAEQLNANMR